MDNLENKTPIDLSVEDLRAQYDSLQNLVVWVTVLLILLSISFNLFAWRQLRFTRADLAAVRPGASQIINDYASGSARAMDEFVNKMRDFGRTHADFEPILAKYGIKPAAATGAVNIATPPSTTPAPAPAKAKK